MQLTEQQIIQILPSSRSRAAEFVAPLNSTMALYGINTPARAAAFIAQVGHESGQFRYVRELGSDAYLSKYDIGSLAKRLGNTPEADGDGQMFRGRGLIQITGRDNYQKCSLALFSDTRLLNQPELLEQPAWAAMSAGWFWSTKKLNALADVGDFEGITRKINGGTNGLAERTEFYKRALKVLA